MKKYIALHRAINVSGHNVIEMQRLRALFEGAGFHNVRTYIQSGNVVFESDASDDDILRKQIEQMLLEKAGMDVPTMVRSMEEMSGVVGRNPFAEAVLGKHLMLYVAFLNEPPAADHAGDLENFSNELERYRVVGREAYCLIRKDTTEKVQFSNMFIEKKLKTPATTRNWNTVEKLLTF
jgi:uncharacterized protein (DUF1697 family)